MTDRPLDPSEALAWAIHLVDNEDHQPPHCCPHWWDQDVDMAARYLEKLGELGAHIAYDVSLPEVAPSRGPRTSDIAAESIDNLNERQWSVWWLLKFCGPLTDEELVEHYEDPYLYAADDGWPKQTPQSIRTRRKELVRAGHVIDTGRTHPTRSGRAAIVWQAVVEAGRVAA